MLFRRQVTVSFFKPALVLTMAITTFIFSCIAPKKNQYPKHKAFVYKINIKVEGKQTNNEKQDLETRLSNQLDDSMRVRTVTDIRWKFPFFYRKIVDPPVFDTANVSRSNNFMGALLSSIGYYSPVIKDSFKIDSFKDQYRAIINFHVNPGKNLKLDSIAYDLQTPELQALVLKNKKTSLLKKGGPFSKQIISDELDRIIKLFHNNGYYKFSIKDIYAEKDTVLSALIDPTLDPFQQAQLLEELKKKRENPTINIVFRQRPPEDSSEIKKFYIDSVTVFPDLPLVEDTTDVVVKNDTLKKNKITIISRTDKFKPSVIYKNLGIVPGTLYKQDDYYKTLNLFGNQLGAWQRASLDFHESDSSDSLLNAMLLLYPNKKQNIGGELEASYNTNDILTATNLFGIGANLSLKNRNAFHRSIQTNTVIHGGIELGSDFIQTEQASFSHTISFPHSPAFWWFKNADSKNTSLNFNASYTDRRDLFILSSLETFLGWDWTTGNKTYIFRPVNIELNNLTTIGDSLTNAIDTVPILKTAFKTGLVISRQFIYGSTKQHGKNTVFLRTTAEESGTLLGLINSINHSQLLRFVKADIEYRLHKDYDKDHQLALRLYAGTGLEYGAGKGIDQTLPFYKAFFAGGLNSMRGWQVRQLGLGSSPFYNESKYVYDRFGDVKIEGNIEYRFLIGTLFGVKIGSALYTDVGNIWDWTPIDTTQASKGSNFALNRFYKEFAVDAGTGLRLDFNYFVLRFDWAYKIRDPQRIDHPNTWFYDMHLSDGQFQLGIGYPF